MSAIADEEYFDFTDLVEDDDDGETAVGQPGVALSSSRQATKIWTKLGEVPNRNQPASVCMDITETRF
ncbi:hypothetical protein [Pseudomonas sp. lyk4-40-TSB-59a]|uniref:hypothetical protein n=1 Tax=Pseudomonas sp. lyk4-40-TSB-59a TaxID=3040314 RepID=UPI0025579666|nr:hypothetical protein [Pseudomonas sp. lyk4-40-TSB-59a]